MPRVTIVSGRRSGETLDLAAGEHQIGTGSSAAIQLRDKDVSFKHAKLVVEGGQVFLEDLKSKAGTFVNGKKVDQRVQLSHEDTVVVGQAELKIELDAAARSAPAPATAAPAPAAPAEPEPAPPAFGDDEPAPAARDAGPPEEPLPDDPAAVRQLALELRRRLREKTQEAEALHKAIEAGGASGGDLGGFAASVESDLEARVLEYQTIADEKAAALLEKDEELREARRELELLKTRAEESRGNDERDREMMAGEILRRDERVEEAKKTVDEAQAEVARFEQVNSELLLETEELKEKLAALQYQLEQEQAGRGSLVRERTSGLQKDAERLEQSNAEMRTLAEAYEEKIDELDERVEELEGENEALENLLNETRAELGKVKNERETTVKTLRQKLKRLEDKAEELQGDRARAQAASNRSDAQLQDQAT